MSKLLFKCNLHRTNVSLTLLHLWSWSASSWNNLLLSDSILHSFLFRMKKSVRKSRFKRDDNNQERLNKSRRGSKVCHWNAQRGMSYVHIDEAKTNLIPSLNSRGQIVFMPEISESEILAHLHAASPFLSLSWWGWSSSRGGVTSGFSLSDFISLLCVCKFQFSSHFETDLILHNNKSLE